MQNDELKYWIALKSVSGIGNAAIVSLAEHFSSMEEAFSAPPAQLSGISGLSRESATCVSRFNSWDRIHRELEQVHQAGISIVTCRDEHYPERLMSVYDRPALLYVIGQLDPQDISIAIVGSRQASAYGRYTTERISRELAMRGLTIVSGMARGIDSCAHRGALAAKGRTVAVLGSGLDVIYPPENKNLSAAIAEQGAVVSEYPPGTQPMPFHFPARNRIISGMSYGVVVVEAGEKSGSLITARLAIDQGRDVFAIPGAIDSAGARGTNSLIKQGAKLVDSVDDILEDILPQLERSCARAASLVCPASEAQEPLEKTDNQLNETDQTIVNILSKKRITHADEIISLSGLPPGDVLGSLSTLEIKGIVEQHSGKFFTRKS
ncbi:MAG: DNA-processing protein DprA [Smithellaceae bacterium]